MDSFGERIRDYLAKAAREPSPHQLARPQEDHETALCDPRRRAARRGAGARVPRRHAPAGRSGRALGAVNSLAQLALAGGPRGRRLLPASCFDAHAGRSDTGGWSTRRACAPAGRLEREASDAASLAGLVRDWRDGRLSPWSPGALRARRAEPDLFPRGDYLPLEASGHAASHLFAFARRRDAWLVCAVPRSGPPGHRLRWRSGAPARHRATLPAGAPAEWPTS
jgi:(1->4)-alpha-D-glucan 1-alpha-D-glucosylmutase